MKTTTLNILIVLFLTAGLNAQTFEWAKSFGGSSYDRGYSITVDASGNIYITGYFEGTVDFDPGIGTANLTSAGATDVFVQKLDASGNFIWAKSFGGTIVAEGRSITVDASGNVYTTGYFEGTVDFDPGTGIVNLTSAGFKDIFVHKLDASGNLVWVKTFGGSSGSSDDQGHSITLDASGNVYTIGHFEGTADFDPGTGIANLTSAGDKDIFVQKLDASGNFIWAKSFGGILSDYGYSIRLDASGNVYTTGYFEGTVDFDPGIGTANHTSVGGGDVFVQKLDTSGNFIWAKSFGGSEWDVGVSITVDASGNVYTTGHFEGTADFDPGAGTTNITSAGDKDIFVQKLDASGNLVWTKSFGGSEFDIGLSITLDASGNVYTTGHFDGTADFDPGAGTNNLTSVGSGDVFVQKLDTSGNLVWAKSFGGSEWDVGLSITVDASGNVYTTGGFDGTADFDPGVGTSNLTSTGTYDIFVHKLSPCTPNSGSQTETACDSYTWTANSITYNTSGTYTTTLNNIAGCDSIVTLNLTINSSSLGPQTFEWAKSFGASDDDNGNSITVDASGNIYTTGYFEGTVDFDPGVGTANLSSVGSRDVFVQKLDASGNFIWAKSFGASDDDRGYSITVDASGNVYTTGYFEGIVDFDPGGGLANHTSVGHTDIFVQKLDASGNFIWAKSFGGSSFDFGYTINVDTSGNVYTTGYFDGTVDFDPGAGTTNLFSAGQYDIFVQKLDASGNFIWAKSFGASDDDYGFSITVDALGNVYATGAFSGIADFDPGAGLANHSSAGGYDVFVQKLDASGNLVWAKSFGGSEWDVGYAITVDASGNVYTTGYFEGTIDVDPGAGTVNLTSTGYSDIFVQKLDASGNFIWAKSFGDSEWDVGYAITADASGNVYTTGAFSGTVDFDPGSGLANHSSAGGFDVFVQKLDASGNFIWAKSFGGSSNDQGSSITVDDSGNVHTLGYFQDTVDFDPGTGTAYLASVGNFDIFVQKLSPAHFTDVKTACDSYTWIDGNTYTASNNTATFTLTNVAGCDSLITLNLTIINSATGTDTITECNSYTWIDGNTYTTSNNTATFNIVGGAVNGCDSLVTLILTINSISDITTSVSGLTITANNSGATYQWLDCENNYTQIVEETGQTFTATANGIYAVELTENGCVDTSACVVITTVDLIENGFGETIVIYPNPTKECFTIDLGSIYENTQVSIYNVAGSLIDSRVILQSQILNLSIYEPTGIYFIEITSGDKMTKLKLIKQ